MSTPVEFSVRYVGESPGMFTGALSVSAFHGPLTNLLRALQDSVDSVAANELPSRRRRRPGRRFDLQLTSVTEGSLRLAFVFVPLVGAIEPTVHTANETKVAAAAVTQFVRELKPGWETVVAGEGDTATHKYLASLPEGIRKQEYEVRIGDQVLETAVLRRPEPAPESVDFRAIAPRLRQLRGHIGAINFNKREGSVKLREFNGAPLTCRATADILDLAARLHKVLVIARVLERPGFTRLLNLRAADAPAPQPPSAEERRAHILNRWSKTLDKLAE